MAEIIHKPAVSQQTRELRSPMSSRRGPTSSGAKAPEDHPADSNGSRSKSDDLEVVARIERLEASLRKETEQRAKAAERADGAERRLAALDARLEEERANAERRGFEQGHEAGSAAGRREADEQSAKQIRGLIGICRAAQRDFSNGLDQAVDDGLVEVIYAAVLRVLGEELADRGSIVAVARQVAREVKQSHIVRIRVSPTEYELIKKDVCNAKKGRYPLRADFVPDDRVELGGCIVETATGELDGRLETQLLRLKEILLEARATQTKEQNA